MSTSLVLALLWLVTANVIAMFPSKDHHWRNAYMLIGLGVPLLGLVFWQNGVWVALLVLLAAMSVLRWPVIYLVKWVKGLVNKA
ncbi:uncharacterized protein DUF2484 [Planktotalea frisia]|jgi:hypothetical protein|uniref:DUF2484 family protein n=1 Tax=Planktotalea frisia TaxID=696762 RepID=A0A1L9P292_9RHOB|nr:DUF2484 family protein [Planktotalea frisia]OJI95645.1 hypothetical protein PFRI_01580 [Planktotalea frisia]PZX33347.1 uncharacterized protein DUF2484 [Planktotalea frisia]